MNSIGNKYEIIRPIGAGGFGTVYLVWDKNIQKYFACKYINDSGAGKELGWLRDLKHEALPALHDFIEEEESCCIIMDYVEGLTLEQLIRQKGRCPEEELAAIAMQIAEVLTYLHKRDMPVVFGDLKPENIILEDSGKIKLIDFGTTVRGWGRIPCFYGSQGYMAPEQKEGYVTTESDVYAFGKILFYLATGCHPAYAADEITADEVLRFGVGSGIAEIIERCTKLQPEERYQSGLQLKQVLGESDNCNPKLSVNTGFVYGVAGIIFLIGGIAQKMILHDNIWLLPICTGGILLWISFMIKALKREETMRIYECECSIFLSEAPDKIFVKNNEKKYP